MWHGNEEALRIEVQYRQERARAEIASDRRAALSVTWRRAAGALPGLPSWRGWLALPRWAPARARQQRAGRGG